MSDDKQPQPELTPAEQQQQDQQRVHGQLIVTDVNRQIRNVMEVFGFGGGTSGRTSFEDHELNTMIDLIRDSNPEHLEDAGQALLKARTAITNAAGELGDFIEAVDWEGESGVAFREWGKGLVAHAEKLGEFAQAAGTQITVAGTGLASVRNSLPPRDTRLVRRIPEEIEAPKRVEGNPEYEAALKVEKHRQEAINQANRLASYYAVSEETLAAQEPPRFEKKLDVAMPRPQGYGREGEESGSSPYRNSGSSGSDDSGGVSRHTVSGSRSSAGDGQGYEAPVAVAQVPDKSVSTEINTVAAPPAPVTTTGAPPQPTPSPAVSGGVPNPPVPTGLVNPVKSSSKGAQGPVGGPRPVGGSRATGPAGSGPVANGRSGPPVGRPSPVNGGTASGNAGRAGAGAQSPAAGRSGVTGGRPMAAGHGGASGSTGPRAGRAGIVGGTPQRATGTPGQARGVPRGTVIGAGGTAGAAKPGGRGTPSTRGVVGTPRGGSGPASGTKGFTAGGAGLVRGPAGRKDSRDEEQDDGTPRPDYLVEDRETWEAGRRGTAPPVIE
ncbi:hypothetical protein [Streptomyces sp. NPDC056796]|uniref:hypothetical protein n=1 Tax=Streptomyces sp. NPDC056796 TaxID=3345947 RepID=UPI00369FB79B